MTRHDNELLTNIGANFGLDGFGWIESTAGNSTFAIGGISCSADSIVVTESSVLRMNIGAKKPAHRKSANR